MPARKPPTELTRWTTQMSQGRLPVTLIALHESVGVTNALDLALFCERQGVSYSDIADNAQMVHAVRFADTAWHIRNGNSRAVGLCLTTPVAGYSRAEWLGPQLAKVEISAWWVARACAMFGLPIRHCTYTQIRSALRGNKADGGVLTHDDYTKATGDGTHTDPRNFPMDVCIDLARALTGEPEDMTPDEHTRLVDAQDTAHHAVTRIDETATAIIAFHAELLKRINETAAAILALDAARTTQINTLTAKVDELATTINLLKP